MANLPRESYLTPLERKWDSGMNFKYILSYWKKNCTIWSTSVIGQAKYNYWNLETKLVVSLELMYKVHTRTKWFSPLINLPSSKMFSGILELSKFMSGEIFFNSEHIYYLSIYNVHTYYILYYYTFFPFFQLTGPEPDLTSLGTW